LGFTFLEETLGDRCTNPEHRLHQRAVRAVLGALLPDQGTHLKGHMRSHEELLELSGYARRPREFEELMHILDTELRLVTPTDPEGLALEQDEENHTASGEKYYQLTHDYLVPALRRWLTQKQRETRRGRAELRLSERAALWSARQETRQLPSWWEWWNIELFTRKARWTVTQRKMIASATRHHIIRTVVAAVILLGLGLLGITLARNQSSRHADTLVALLLDAEAIQVPKIIAEIEPYRHWADPKLRHIVDDATRSPKEQLNARMALLSSERGRTEAFVQPLAQALLNHSRPESEREAVASVLADYVTERADLLADLVVKAEPRQAKMLLTSLRDHRDRVIPFMIQQLETEPGQETSEAQRRELVKQRANAAVALLQFGQGEAVWPRFQQIPDLRIYFTHRLAPFGADPKAIIHRLGEEGDVLAKAALILCLGEFPEVSLTTREQEPAVEKLLHYYRNDPDPAIRSAAEWTLRRWKHDVRLLELDKELKPQDLSHPCRWYLNEEGHTMAVISGPIQFQMGSPDDEPDRYGTERLHLEPIPRSFAIATKEVTVGQFERFLQANPRVLDLQRRQDLRKTWNRFSAIPDGPVLGVTWYEAALYCCWLSEKEGIGENQMCYPSVEEIRKGRAIELPAGYLSRTGYRLPTEAEWEYACRAKSGTSRPYGASEEMLEHYAWYSRNTRDRACTVGSLKPNEFGLFDMLGNASEWTNDKARRYNQPDEDEDAIIRQNEQMALRGGSFNNPGSQIRSAHRFIEAAGRSNPIIGFRVTRTLPHRP
jgi:formylglycine-generating enzyme required for sulfatase activity